MKKSILFLFSILLMCQSLTASPLPEPEPQFNIVSGIYASGAFLFNLIVKIVLATVQVMVNSIVYTVVFISQFVIMAITQTSPTIANTFISLNATGLNVIGALNNASIDFNMTVNSANASVATTDAAGVIFGTNLIENAGLSVEVIACGVQSFAAILSGMQPTPCNFTNLQPNGPPNYPQAPAIIPAQPTLVMPYLPYAPTISVQARYALQVLGRLMKDVSGAVQSINEIRNATGINCTGNCSSWATNLTDAYANVTIILNAQVNSTVYARLVTVFNATATIQLNDVLNKTRQFLDCMRSNAECGIRNIKAQNNRPFNPFIDALRNGTITPAQYNSSITNIFQLSINNSRTFVQRFFIRLNLTRDFANALVKVSRDSLIAQIAVSVTKFNTNAYYIWDALVLPKVSLIKTQLSGIQPCLQVLFTNMTNHANQTNNATQMAFNATYQNASSVVNATITTLVKMILADATSTSNCQLNLNTVLAIQTTFEVQAAKCVERSKNWTQASVTNSTNTTISVSNMFNNITSGVDKCVQATGAYNIGYVSYATVTVRTTAANCLSPFVQQTTSFCADSNIIGMQSNSNVTENANNSLAQAQLCFNGIVNAALASADALTRTYTGCARSV